MLKKLKSHFSELARGKPGRRFIDHHERHRQSEKGNQFTWKTAAYVGAGVGLLLAGLLLSLPPGIPGFVLWVPGLGLLVVRFRFLAVGLDRVELFVRGIVGRFRRR